MDRKEHLEWCKKRALAYLDRGDVKSAVASMMSDIKKNPETNGPGLDPIHMLGMMAAMNDDAGDARRYIEGFN